VSSPHDPGWDSYGDVIAALGDMGLPSVLTSTGGGHAAVEVALETGQHLLISDAADGLSRDRHQQLGWGVGLYRQGSEYDDGPTRYDATEDDVTDVPALLDLVRTVLAPN